ncbi:aldehyde dehydrogenase family protein [Mycobacterium ulcerans str. Harvey]|uniref:Aldehyde dehydrogenase family protein n=1 Tax=Mycobacterium ulcerans str. Harvey TaxID=1299332 RepID=A0ABN0R9P6_MYCUL|nr:aldehyde dehydrogenase family protein [Mycobacterium ulcerans str. Harvey]
MSSIATGPTMQKDDGQPQIPVENPATGEVIGHVPDMSAAQIAELAGGPGRPTGLGGAGYEGRAVVLKRMQRWLVDNADQVIATICSETGKTYEDAQIAELIYGAAAFGFWADKAPRYLADERIHSSSVFVKGKRLVLRYRPMGLIGVIGPWNYPLTNSFGDCIPALAPETA